MKTLGTVEITEEQFQRLKDARNEFTMAEGVVAEELMEAWALGSDLGDMWGSVMGELFDLCEHLTFRGDEVPVDWEFRPGAGEQRDPGREDFGEHDADVRHGCGEFLLTMREVLEEQGASY